MGDALSLALGDDRTASSGNARRSDNLKVGHMTLPFTVVWDNDNTLLQYTAGFQVFLRRIGHPAGELPPPTDYNFAKAGWFATIEEFLAYHKQAVMDGLFLDLEPSPGAQDTVRALDDMGVRQVIATYRDIPGIDDIVRDTTFASLRESFNVDFAEIVFTRDKWTVPGDLYVDDSPSVIESLDARGLARLVIDGPNYNQHLPGPRVQTCAEVVPHIAALLAARAGVAA